MIASSLSRVPLFAGLPPTAIDELAATLRSATYPTHTILFYEGDVGDRFYIVLDGMIEIVKALGTEDERLVAERGAGEFVGEMSLLSQDGLRTATARVEVEAHVLELNRAEFDTLLHRYPLLAYDMLRVLSERLNASHRASIRDLHEKNERLARAYADLKAAQSLLIEQEALARELRLASEIQESMLPRYLPELPGVDLGARMIPARVVGGDFYDVIQLSPTRLGLVIGDVSGKGVPAALFMALTCSLIRAEALRGGTPEHVLRAVNRQQLMMNAKGMFVTVLYGVLDRASGIFEYVRAGHELPLIWDGCGTFVVVPEGRGLPLGMFGEPVFDRQTLGLPPGAMLLLYTDGVTDATNVQGDQFGLERLRSLIQSGPRAGAQGLCDAIVRELAAFHAGASQFDDVTVLAAACA